MVATLFCDDEDDGKGELAWILAGVMLATQLPLDTTVILPLPKGTLPTSN